MKKILNKKFLVGFLFVFVVVLIFVSSHVLKTKAAAGTLDVSMWAIPSTLPDPVTGYTSTISWSSPAGSTCTGDAPGGGNSGYFDVTLTETTTYSVDCAKAESCTGTMPGTCGPNSQSVNCGRANDNDTCGNGCIWHGETYDYEEGYCSNDQYMMCSDMQSEDDCNSASCTWDPPVADSCSTISDSSACTSTSGCTWE